MASWCLVPVNPGLARSFVPITVTSYSCSEAIAGHLRVFFVQNVQCKETICAGQLQEALWQADLINHISIIVSQMAKYQRTVLQIRLELKFLHLTYTRNVSTTVKTIKLELILNSTLIHS